MTQTPSMESKPTKRSAAVTSALSSLLFVVVYGGCNWIASQRATVGTWYCGWERHIPFVPVMIVPYMSINLFFVAAPFLCESQSELRAFARRVTCAVLIAGVFFLTMPLQFGRPVPQTSGWTGALYGFLHGFDRPTNLFPSLHITLRTILAHLYARHTRGPRRVASHAWFVLIGFSTLLTWQHHVADVIGGFVLAAFCFYLIPENQARLALVPNRRVGGYYAAGAIACLGLGMAWWPWTAILFWPAVALGIVALAYNGLGPAVFRKNGGRLLVSSKLVLAPYLVGQHLSLWHYRRQCKGWNKLTSYIWIGGKLNESEAWDLRRCGVIAVLDLTAEFSETPAFLGISYCNVPVLDLTGLNADHLQRSVSFIAEHQQKGVVYVHCKIGYSRTAAAAGAYLISSGIAETPARAVAMLRTARPTIIVRPESQAALANFKIQCEGIH
jgi:membrane-associated phospholipid phosphatase/rhodanese-related sulfurtransferase